MIKLFTFFILVFSSFAFADDPAKGLAIATEVDARDTGWMDSSVTMNMTLIDRKGRESTREIKSKTLEVLDDGDKSLSLFESPRDVKGTAMLTFSHRLDADEQWLYLPALKRVKRISSRNKSGPFMGSEFAYEDISSQEVEKFAHTYLRDDVVGETAVFVTQRVPKYKFSGYTKQIAYIDKERYIPVKIEYYDRKDALLKTLVMSDYQQYLGKYWRAGTLTMTNHQNGKKTILNFEGYAFNTGLTDNDFKSSKLKRLR